MTYTSTARRLRWRQADPNELHDLAATLPETVAKLTALLKTEVDPDPMRDREKLEQSYKNPSQFEDIRMFPGTDFEFIRPRRKDIVGFTGSVVLCGVIVLLLLGLVSIGS